MSKVSIILPVYNGQQTLARCLESIECQTLEDIQVVIVNNGSKDDSIKILKKYKKNFPKIKLIDKVNGNMSTCKNMALSLADSKYVCFVNQADTLEPEYIETMYNEIVKEKSDIVISDICRINYLGSEIALGINNNKNLDFSVVTDYSFIYNKMYRKDFIEKSNIEFDNKLYYADFKFFLDVILLKPKISYVNKALYTMYEKVDRSMLSKKKLEKKIEELFDILNNYENTNEKIEYICIDMLLYNGVDKLLQVQRIKAEIINIFKVRYIYWKKNKYFKTKSFRYKLRCAKTFKKLSK